MKTYEYQVKCKDYRNDVPYDICQKEITSGAAEDVKVAIPRDYTFQNYLQEKLYGLGLDKDADSLFIQGENLVFDLTVVDKFGNQVEDYDLTTLSAGFYYGHGLSSIGDLTAIILSKAIHFSAAYQSHNIVFQNLPPRDHYYAIKVNDTTGVLTKEVPIEIVNLDDPHYPKNLFLDGDDQSLEVKATQITYADTMHIGEANEISVRLFTETLL